MGVAGAVGIDGVDREACDVLDVIVLRQPAAIGPHAYQRAVPAPREVCGRPRGITFACEDMSFAPIGADPGGLRQYRIEGRARNIGDDGSRIEEQARAVTQCGEPRQEGRGTLRLVERIARQQGKVVGGGVEFREMARIDGALGAMVRDEAALAGRINDDSTTALVDRGPPCAGDGDAFRPQVTERHVGQHARSQHAAVGHLRPHALGRHHGIEAAAGSHGEGARLDFFAGCGNVIDAVDEVDDDA